jgi:hypothetical protein
MELINSPLFGDANLVGYWRLEGNSNDSKASNNGTDTSITYGTSYGKFGQGALFTSASNSKIIFGDVLDAGTSAWTVGCWMKTSSHGADTGYLVAKNNFDTVGYFLNVASAKAVFACDTGGNTTSSTSVNDGNWHFIVGTREVSGGNKIMKIYVDGVLDATGSTVAGQDLQNAQNLALGMQQINSSAYQAPFNGSIDDVFIFNRNLTSTEISNLYNQGLGFFTYFM